MLGVKKENREVKGLEHARGRLPCSDGDVCGLVEDR